MNEVGESFGTHDPAAAAEGAAAAGPAHHPARSQPGDHDGVRHRGDRLAARHRRHSAPRCSRGLQKNDVGARRRGRPGDRVRWRSRSTASPPASGTGSTRCAAWFPSHLAAARCERRRVVVVAAVVARVLGSRSFPDALVFDIGPAVDSVVDWVQDNLRKGVPVIGGTQNISDFLGHPTCSNRSASSWCGCRGSWWSRSSAAIGWAQPGLAARGHRVGVRAGHRHHGRRARRPGRPHHHVGPRDEHAQPGARGARHQRRRRGAARACSPAAPTRVEQMLRPFLDTAQVLPAVRVPRAGAVPVRRRPRRPGVIASVIYAVPPCIRLTALGLRGGAVHAARGGDLVRRHAAPGAAGRCSCRWRSRRSCSASTRPC